jgi:hypothetical protein
MMMTKSTEPESIQFMLGRMEATLTVLVEQGAKTEALVKGNFDHFTRLDSSKAEALARLTARVDTLAGQVDTIVPSIARWSRWQQIGVGVILTVSGLAGLFAGGMKAITTYFPSLLGR